MRFLKLYSDRVLPQWIADDGLTVKLDEGWDDSPADGAKAQRSSPVHKLAGKADAPDLSHGSWRVHFFVLADPFPALGRISRGSYSELREHAWYGIGLASVVFFLPNDDPLRRFINDCGNDVVAHEVWNVTGGSVLEITSSGPPNTSKALPSGILSTSHSSTPADVRGIIEEFDACFHELHRWSHLYAPDEKPMLDRLGNEVRVLATELSWLSSTSTEPTPSALEEFDPSNRLERARLIQQRFDRIIQINSSLSYVISQAFFGAPPILVNSALVRRHSLLGVGRAHRAILNLVREVESALRKFSIPLSIRRSWGQAPRLVGLNSGISEPERWCHGNLPDELLEMRSPPDPYKLVYFSGRLGFRESEYSVCAAIHCLNSGEDPEWHLSTMTHEVLHGHVRDVLDVIFGPVRPDDPKNVLEFRSTILNRFREHMVSGDNEAFRLIDSTRSLLLSYCCCVERMGSITQLPQKPIERHDGLYLGQMFIPDDDSDLIRLLESEKKNLGEMLVHVLDLYYFYFDDFDHFNKAIWSSWRSVPSVLRDVRQYVLRSLLARAAVDKGRPSLRFARARRDVLQGLRDLSEVIEGDAAIERAIKLLSVTGEEPASNGSEPQEVDFVKEAQHPLFPTFLAGLPVVDFGRQCLASKKIRQEFFHDDMVAQFHEDGAIAPEFTPGEFVDHSVESVAEFTALSVNARPGPVLMADTEARTAWYFLACGALPNRQRDGMSG